MERLFLTHVFLNTVLGFLLTLHTNHSIRSLLYRYFLQDIYFVFFLGYDIHLNSMVFHWPNKIEIMFDNSRDELYSRRNHIEMVLLERYGVKTFSYTGYF